MSPAGDEIVAEWVVHPLADLMGQRRDVLAGAEKLSGLVIADRKRLHRAPLCAVVTQDAAVGEGGSSEGDYHVVKDKNRQGGRTYSSRGGQTCDQRLSLARRIHALKSRIPESCIDNSKRSAGTSPAKLVRLVSQAIRGRRHGHGLSRRDGDRTERVMETVAGYHHGRPETGPLEFVDM